MAFYYAVFFLIGLAFGSFINVVSLRFQPENRVFDPKKIGGRSACPHCKKPLRWYELIPLLSFFAQKGRCRSCGHKLSWQYPAVEFLAGLLLLALPLMSFPHRMASPDYYFIGFWAVWVLVLLILLLLSLIDLKHYYIPDELVWIMIIMGFALIFLESRISVFNLKFINHSFLGHYALLFNSGWLNNLWLNHLFAGLISCLFFGLLFFFGKGKILGGGDVKLGFALGWLLGWPDVLMALFIAFILGGIVGLILIAKRKKTMKEFLPLAPFLSIGTALTVLWGYQIISGYFRLFGL